MRIRTARKWFSTRWRAHRSQLRFSIRVTVAAIVALLIAQFFALPLHGLWVVLTATVVTQLSVGGSVRTGVEYVIGTLGGAVYAGIIGFLLPHATVPAQVAVLAVTIAPMAFETPGLAGAIPAQLIKKKLLRSTTRRLVSIAVIAAPLLAPVIEKPVQLKQARASTKSRRMQHLTPDVFRL
jgi:uncharacterized membrane protein YgaE (UPF0421/DUF939 family)